MLTPERIMELWQSSHRYSHYNDHEGISHGCNRPDPIAFACAIEQAARREALKLALSEIACATSRSEAYKAIYALIEHETK